ncbi:MAG TPA: ATP-binding protein [Nitrospiria bacterium]|nr:ATP-binding protein [Nitrospiria bacterium]
MKQTYRLTPKLVTLIVGAGLLSITIALMIVYFVQKGALTNSIGLQFKTVATVTSARLADLLDQTLNEANLLALHPAVTRAVINANRRYNGRTLEQVQQDIRQLDQQWANHSIPVEIRQRYENNEVALYLRSYLQQPIIFDRYFMILVTDMHGLLVASPTPSKAVNFGGQNWWTSAYQDGKGGNYISDVSLAPPTNEFGKTYAIEFAVPIRDPQNHRAIGALMIVSYISHLFTAVTEVQVGATDHTMLANSQGELLFCPVFLIKQHTLKPQLVNALTRSEEPGWTSTYYDVHFSGSRSINGYAPVIPTTQLSPSSFGGHHWFIFTSQNPAETYAPLTRLLTWVSVAGFGGLGLLAVVATLFARRFTQPIRELQEGAKLIGFGNLDYRLTIPTGDEIEELSYEFNEMANKLKTAYTNLEQRVAQRTRELEHRNRQLSILYAISSSLSAATELNGLLSTVLATVTQQLGSSVTFIHLLDLTPPLYSSDDRSGSDRESLEREVLDACKKCMQPPAQAVQLKQMLAHGGDGPGASPGNGAHDNTGQASMLLSIPLVSKNRIIGAMALWYRPDSGLRLEHDRHLLLTLGQQIGAAIEAAQLFEQTKKLDKLKSEFVSKVSHELRTPLTSIKGFGEILASYDDIDPANRLEFIQIINEESDRLTRLINDLLDLSKIEAGKIEWMIQPIDVGQILRYTIKQFQTVTLKKPLTLTLDLPPALPLAMGDRDQLVQVMENLLSNAVKFTPQGSITAGALWPPADEPGADRQTPPFLTIFVQDTGIGIPSDKLTAIFEKFHQITDINLTLPKGTGLGLALCREIIHHLGGKIWAESTLGGGSRFLFTLPVAIPITLRPTVQPPAAARSGPT